MNLEDFVSNVLVELDNAVNKARKATSRDIVFSHTDSNRTVEFDIAVSVEGTDSKEGKAGVKVLQFAEAGGVVNKISKNSTVSRVKFGLKIESLTHDEQKKLDDESRNSNMIQGGGQPLFSLDDPH